MNMSLRFFKPQYIKSDMTPDVVYVPMNMSLRF